MSEYQVTADLIKQVITPPNQDSHKGDNGKILVIGGSFLFHGAGILSAEAVYEILISFASITNDMVYFASSKENLDILKLKVNNFIGIQREQIDDYMKTVNVILAGPGLMREVDKNSPKTEDEPDFTKSVVKKVLASNKKIVLDAGCLQVIRAADLLGASKVIITPHRLEMAKLFNLNPDDLATSHDFSLDQIEKVALVVHELAKKYSITILLKGPIDIIASTKGWYYTKGGNAGMTKGGTGDVLAGVVAALYSRADDPLLVAASASLIVKKAGDKLWQDDLWLYNSTDLAKKVKDVIKDTLVSELKS